MLIPMTTTTIPMLRSSARLVETARRIVRYGTVSVVSTTVSLSVLGLLVATRTLPAGIANVVATAAGVGPSFELNRRWVWGKRGERSVRRELMPFIALTIAGLVLSTLSVAVTAWWTDQTGATTAVRTIAVEIANLTGFGVVWIAEFVILDRIVFGAKAT
jgi:putative flippase GtrA